MVPEPRNAYALRFFILSTTLICVAAGVSLALTHFIPQSGSTRANRFSMAFGVSTVMLFTGSFCLFRALEAVRRERQRPFRRWLMRALIAGTIFVAVQTFALSRLIRQQPPDEAETGAAAFAAVFACLHGMHFFIALLFLCYITVQALADRYDHEYYFGVTICAWFWHFLGMAWVAILFVMFVARFFSEG